MPELLLIDGDPSFTYLMARYAQLCGCNMRQVANLVDAQTAISTHAPALILLHLAPPSQQGLELLRALRQEIAAGGCPILLCGSITDAAGAWEAGADYWLSKPVMLDDFRAALQSAGILANGATTSAHP